MTVKFKKTNSVSGALASMWYVCSTEFAWQHGAVSSAAQPSSYDEVRWRPHKKPKFTDFSGRRSPLTPYTRS